MINRQKLIEDILNNFYTIRHKIEIKGINSKDSNCITHSQWFVLGIIKHYKNSNIKYISEMLGMSSSAVTQLVDSLVKNDYVIRQSNFKDRRSIRLELSPKGKKQIVAMKKKYINRLAKLFDALSDSELKMYLRLNKKITSKNLNKKL